MNYLACRRKIMRKSGVLFLGLLLGMGAVTMSDWGTPSFASNVGFSVNPAGYYINISSIGSLSANINPGMNSGLAVVKDTVLVKTNIKSGYKLFLSTNKTGEEGERMTLKENAGNYFSGVGHSLANPGTLTDNSWGFAIKKADSPGFSEQFDEEYTIVGPAISSKWAKVPRKETPVGIATHNAATYDPNIPSVPGKSLEVYFGMRANMLPAGEYEAGILYSAVGNTNNSSNATVEQSYTGEVTPKVVHNLNGGDSISITTSLYTTSDLGEIRVKIGEKDCIGINANNVSGVVSIVCKTPENEEGKYDVVVEIPKYSLNLNLKKALEYEKSKTTFNGITTMQQMTPEVCNAETTPYVFENGESSGNIVANITRLHSKDRNLVPETELIDIRDNKTYIVRKLADGRCWMVQNLDLSLSTETALTSETSDISGSWTPNNSTQENTGISWDSQMQDNQDRSYNPGEKYLIGTESADQVVNDSGPKTAHVGNLYNWHAATAGSGTYEMKGLGREAPHSICPKGWKLPYNKNDKDNIADLEGFIKLFNVYGIISGADDGNSDVALLSAPFNFIRGGGYSGNKHTLQGQRMYLWASSVSKNGISTLAARKTAIYNNNDMPKGYGFAIRCVARDPKLDDRRTIFDITNMQEMTTRICKNTTKPSSLSDTSAFAHEYDDSLVPEKELRDVRDGKTYVVRKLADGRCWMVQNLDLDLSTGTALTSADSDVAGSWTPQNSTDSNTGVSWGDAYNTTNQARSYNPGDKYLTGTGSANQTVSDSGLKTAHVGNLYNWYAATAGSGTYNMSTPGQTAPYSICPKGWKLPYGNNSQSNTADSGDFRKLTNTYGITSGANYTDNNVTLADKLISAPLSFVRSGYYNYSNGSYSNQGSGGYFWPSSVYNQNTAHFLYFSSSYVDPQDVDSKGNGFSVRCLAR